jgi:hypothetical protein
MHLSLHRKILFGAAAFVLPLSTVGIVMATGGTAFAKSGPNGNTITCSFGTTVNFASPGLSSKGSLSSSKISDTTTDPTSTNCGSYGGTGAFPGETIASKSTQKCKGKASDPSPCSGTTADKGQWVYDTESGFASTGATSIVKSLKKLSFSVSGGTAGALTFLIKSSSAQEIVSAAPCAANEVGFQITGQIKLPKSPLNYKGGTSTLTACLLGDSGPGTTGNFESDLLNGTGTIATATIDPATSSLVLTS